MGILRELFEQDPGPKVLDYILTHPDELLVHHHIEKVTGLSYATVERVLSELEEKGIVLREKAGKREVYKFNRGDEFSGKVLKFFYGQRIIKNLPCAIFIVDVETGNIIDTNPAAEDLLNMTREEILQVKYWEIHPQGKQEYYKRLFVESLKENGESEETLPKPHDFYVVDSNGDDIPVKIRDGEVLEMGGLKLRPRIICDISNLKEEEKFRCLFEICSDPAYFVGEEGVVRKVNSSFCQLTDFSKDEVEGMELSELLSETVAPEDKEKTLKSFRKQMSGEEVPPYTIKIEAEGGVRQKKIESSTVKRGSEILGILNVIKDPTDSINAG